MPLTNKLHEKLDATVAGVGAVRRVTFAAGTELLAVLCPDHSKDQYGLFEGSYWLASHYGREWGEFDCNIGDDRIQPSGLDREAEARFIADLAMGLREQIMASMPERRAEAIARRREEDPDFRPEVDYLDRVGSDSIAYAQLADVLHALAARFAENAPMMSTPLPTED